jgi:hypothetical protein
MKKMLAFDGDKHIELTGTEIDQLNPDKLVELFKSTAAINELVQDLAPAIKAGFVTGVCGHSVDTNYADDLFDGFVNLRLQLDMVFGEESALTISEQIMSNIKNK